MVLTLLWDVLRGPSLSEQRYHYFTRSAAAYHCRRLRPSHRSRALRSRCRSACTRGSSLARWSSSCRTALSLFASLLGLPFFVAQDKASYRNQLVAIGVLNGIIGEDHQAVQSPHSGADSHAEDRSISQTCLYKKYFGMPTEAT